MIAQVQQRPQVAVAPQDNVRATAAITAIGAAKGRKLIAAKVFIAGAPMPAAAKYPYLVDKVLFFHAAVLRRQSNDESGDKLFQMPIVLTGNVAQLYMFPFPTSNQLTPELEHAGFQK